MPPPRYAMVLKKTHLTLTGPLAGTPLCGIRRTDALHDDFVHLPYGDATQLLARTDICLACKRVYETEE